MAYGTVNADVIGTSVAGSNLGAGNASAMKNRIINGAMVISQRNGTSSFTPVTGDYLVDRFAYYVSQSSKFTVQQNAGSVTPPVGFSNYLGLTVASAVTIGAGDYFFIDQCIEGFNTADLGWGTANAKTVTLSFQVYSSLTGTFGGSISNSAQTYAYPFSYSIPIANTWTSISITITGPTSGTWIGATNGIGLRVNLGLGVGSTYSGTAGAWASTAAIWSATGATSVVGTNGATFYITGIQLEVGSSATGFEYRQYGTELSLCQRYYENYTGSFYLALMAGNGVSASYFKVNKRAAPTITYNTTGGSISSTNPTIQAISFVIYGTTTTAVDSWTASAEL